MILRQFKDKTPYEIGIQANKSIQEEYDGCNLSLNLEEYKALQKYYHSALASKERRYIYEHLYAERLEYIVFLLISGARPVKILDAGCGVGSESILFALLGAEVIGVDLDKPRLNVAKKRKEYYQSLIGRRLNLNFLQQNVSRVMKEYKFDIIWLNEAISHIHPAEEFLSRSYQNLKRGGRIIISESNPLNPYIILKRFYQTRHFKETISQIKDPRTGEIVAYAHERLFSILRMRKMLKRMGFGIEHIELTHYLPAFLIRNQLVFKLINKLEKRLANFPFIKWIGLDYRIAGSK